MLTEPRVSLLMPPSETDARASVLAAVDTLAAQALDWVLPVRFALAESDAAREVAFRLRYRAVIERGWKRPEEMPGGLERDEYDERALHILAWDGSTPVATSRLVLPEAGRRLPTEEAFDLVIEPQGRVVDAGRFVVARELSSMEHRMLAALVSRSWLEVRAHGWSHVCAAFASRAMIRVYRQMGMEVTVLGPPRVYWGDERLPVRFEAAAALPALLERWLTPAVDTTGRE